MITKITNEDLERHAKWLDGEDGGVRIMVESWADLQEADLQGADLQKADLQGADFDYSCFPLWCGSAGMKFDKRLFCQLVAHLCALDVDDEECKKAQIALLPLAKQSHRAGELQKWFVKERNDD